VWQGWHGGEPASSSSPGPARGKEEGPDRWAPPISARERRREGARAWTGGVHGWTAEARMRLGRGKEEGRASWAARGKEGKGERERLAGPRRRKRGRL
jgi:hypothetical protein